MKKLTGLSAAIFIGVPSIVSAQSSNDANPSPVPSPPPVIVAPPPIVAPALPPPPPPPPPQPVAETRLPSKADFRLCDGYREPSKKADRMLEGNTLFGLSKGTRDIRRNQTLVGASGVAACDRALNNPLLQDKFWQRRAHLLQAKALHLIGTASYEKALSALAQSDTIGQTNKDIMFDGSIGIGNQMLRAIALGRSGEKEEAFAVINAAQKTRPHALSINQSLERIRNDVTGDIDDMMMRAEAGIPLNPNIARILFPIYMIRGLPEKAAALSDRVSLVDPKPVGNWKISGAGNELQEFRKSREWSLRRAYTQAALGNYDKAAAMIDGVRSEVTEFVGTAPLPRGKRKRVSKSQQRDYDQRVAVGKLISADILRWENAIKIRREMGSNSYQETVAQINGDQAGTIETFIDLLKLVARTYPEQAIEEKEATELLDKALTNQILKLRDSQLPRILPRPESLSQFPRFARSGDGILLGRDTGYNQAKEKDSDARTVRFGTLSGTSAMTDEMVLRAVAEYAQKEGKDAFILLSRRTITRTMTVTSYYGGGNTSNHGYEAQVRTVLLDSNAIPAEYASQPERILKVDAVLADILPRHREIEAQQAASKKRR